MASACPATSDPVIPLDSAAKASTATSKDSGPSTRTPLICPRSNILASTAASGTYKVYATLEGGASGTATFQLRIRHTTGAASTIVLVKGGSGLANNVFIVTGTGAVAPPDAAAVDVHTTHIMGRGYLGCTNLGGLEAFFIPRRASESDPLAQRAKASWKQIFKALVLNPDFGLRLESASDF